jgi:phospholipase C
MLSSPTQLQASTAILTIADEGIEYWNSRNIQPVDFFGDSPRISLIAVLPYSRSGGGA